MSEIDDMLRMFQQQMQNVTTVNFVRDAASAYERFATAAMSELLAKMDRTELNFKMFDALAHDAWRIADAMMHERRERGFGGPTSNTSTPTTEASNVPEDSR